MPAYPDGMHMKTSTLPRHDLDLTAPGAIEELFAFHRAIFGDAVMKDDDGDDDGDDDLDDDDGDDDGDDDEGKDGKEGKGGDDKEWKPPTKEEYERQLANHQKLRKEARKHRLEAKALKDASEGADGKAAREAAEAAEKRFKPIAVRSAARAAFVEAGLIGKPDRLVKLIDMDSVEVDEDGEIDGLDDQVDKIKEDYPELFEARRKRAPRVDKDDKGGGSGTKKSTSQRLAEQAQRAQR